jgi:hypothetical protein
MISWLFSLVGSLVFGILGPGLVVTAVVYYFMRGHKRRVSTPTGGQPMLGFLKAFAGVKGQAVAKQVTEALVTMDPKAASEAQLKVMEADLDEVGILLQHTRADHQREVTEYEAANRRFQEGLAGAEVLKRKIAEAESPGFLPKKDLAGALQGAQQFRDALDRLLQHLEDQKAALDREKADVDQAAALLHEVEQAFHDKANQLGNAKADLERAQRDMSRSEIEAQRAKARSEQVAKVAGLRDGETNSLSTAIDAMKNRAAQNRMAAQAATDKATVLKAGPAGDAVIDAAIAEGRPPTTTKSTEDRLAALKQ